MKAIFPIAFLLLNFVLNLSANAASSTILDNYYKPQVNSCKLDYTVTPADSIELSKNLNLKGDKGFTASVFLLEVSKINEYVNTYYYRIKYKGKVVSNVLVNTIQNKHPHGGEPNGVNVGITACTTGKIKPTIRISDTSKRLNGYINPQYLTHTNEFKWKNIIIKK